MISLTLCLTLCLSPSLHLHPSPTQTGPPGSVAWVQAKIVHLLPSSLPALSGLCQSEKQKKADGTLERFTQRREKIKEGRGQSRSKGEYETHSPTVLLAAEPKIGLTFAHFSNLYLIELGLQTTGRLLGEYSRRRGERQM